jgi:hypothetical protein
LSNGGGVLEVGSIAPPHRDTFSMDANADGKGAPTKKNFFTTYRWHVWNGERDFGGGVGVEIEGRLDSFANKTLTTSNSYRFAV